VTRPRVTQEEVTSRETAPFLDRLAAMVANAGITVDEIEARHVSLIVYPVDSNWMEIRARSLAGNERVIGRLSFAGNNARAQDALEGYLQELVLADTPLRPGRPSEREERIGAIVQEVVNGHSTRLGAAQALGRVDEWGIEGSDYKKDVRAAGGWKAIKARARDGLTS
jgi:hypothetical protein